MDFTDKSNKSLAFKKFTNNRYNAERFEQPENPTDIDRITSHQLTPGLSSDELLGLIYSPYYSTVGGKKVYPYMTVTSLGPLVYDDKIIDGAYLVNSASVVDFKVLYEQTYAWSYLIYVFKSGRVLRVTKDTPWQTIVDYLDSLNGGE